MALDGQLSSVYGYSFILTDIPHHHTAWIEHFHRHRAQIEERLKDTKTGQALRHLPSGDINANRVWLTASLLALNLTAWCCDLCPAATASGQAPVNTPAPPPRPHPAPPAVQHPPPGSSAPADDYLPTRRLPARRHLPGNARRHLRAPAALTRAGATPSPVTAPRQPTRARFGTPRAVPTTVRPGDRQHQRASHSPHRRSATPQPATTPTHHYPDQTAEALLTE